MELKSNYFACYSTLVQKLETAQIRAFQNSVWAYYRTNGRHTLPWRNLPVDKQGARDPYKILVSEIMLQQTQVARVIPKYKNFLREFPTVCALAEAKLATVLRVWQGLGYNRRGLYLKKCAEKIVGDFGGKFPKDVRTLLALPGVGPATAGDVLAFAWNIPAIVIETNIRSVFIHHFFANKKKVADKEILPLIEKTLPKEKVRDWYYALMDYGVFIKETTNHNSRSAHYVKQTSFKGSNREKRSALLKLILEKPRTEKELTRLTSFDPIIIRKNLATMVREGIVKKKREKFFVG